jgi:hypothetical protein
MVKNPVTLPPGPRQAYQPIHVQRIGVGISENDRDRFCSLLGGGPSFGHRNNEIDRWTNSSSAKQEAARVSLLRCEARK